MKNTKTKKKEEKIMTDVIVNVKDFIETEEIESNYKTPKTDKILCFLKLKSISNKAREDIKKYIEKNRKIRGGKAVLRGTRITTKELLLIMSEHSKVDSEKDTIDYIREQYPSIDSEEKVIYGALYEISKTNTLIFVLRVLITGK